RRHLFHRPGQPDRNIPTGGSQVAGDDKSIAAVVSRTGQDHSPIRLRKTIQQRASRFLTRILHQYRTRHPELLNGIPVQIAHLLCSVEIQKDVPPNRVITICTALSGYADKDDGLSTPSRNVHLITERKTAVHPQSETGSE